SGAAAPISVIALAMERAIDLRSSSIPQMRVVNMSLSGPTLNPGNDLYQAEAEAMEASGITLVTSAGNAGPSGLTIGTPAATRGTLAVGAAADATHERIRFFTFNNGRDGYLHRLDDQQQVASFSSRGPNADGRLDPEVVANGQSVWMQGPAGSFVIG